MPSRKTVAAAVVFAALLLSTFFFAPVVDYTKSLSLPYNYKPRAFEICNEEAGFNTTTIVGANSTQELVFSACLQREQYPPYNLTGQASLSYYLTGVGTPPFPSSFWFPQGNESGLVYFSGDKVTAAYLLPQNTTVDPVRTFEFLNASVGLDGYGDWFFNATVENTGSSPISGLWTGITGLPGIGENITMGGISWTIPNSMPCSLLLNPGATCSVSTRVGAVNGTELHYFAYIEGSVGGHEFFHRQEIAQTPPQVQLDQQWVRLFTEGVNQARKGSPLVENSTLDRFAAMRFETASSQPQISDYRFTEDAYSFFGTGAANAGVEELLLYPGTQAPYNYAAQLQSAPIHWSALLNSNFTQYGYYIGNAPYYKVSADCPVTEVPSQGINITQYFEGMGCQVTSVPDINWLVLILSP